MAIVLAEFFVVHESLDEKIVNNKCIVRVTDLAVVVLDEDKALFSQILGSPLFINLALGNGAFVLGNQSVVKIEPSVVHLNALTIRGKLVDGISVVLGNRGPDVVGIHGDLIQANLINTVAGSALTLCIVEVDGGVGQLAIHQLIGLEGGIGLAVIPVGGVVLGVIDEHGTGGDFVCVDIDHVNVAIDGRILNVIALEAGQLFVAGVGGESALRGFLGLKQDLGILAELETGICTAAGSINSQVLVTAIVGGKISIAELGIIERVSAVLIDAVSIDGVVIVFVLGSRDFEISNIITLNFVDGSIGLAVGIEEVQIAVSGVNTLAVLHVQGIEDSIVAGELINADDIAIGVEVEVVGLAQSHGLGSERSSAVDSSVSLIEALDLLDVADALAVAGNVGQNSVLGLSLDHGLDLAVGDGDQNHIVSLELVLSLELGVELAFVTVDILVNDSVSGSGVTLGVGLLSNELGDLSEVGVDVDETILIDEGQTALLGLLGIVLVVSDSVGAIAGLAVGVDIELGALLQAGVSIDVAVLGGLGVGGESLDLNGGGLVADIIGPLDGGTAKLIGLLRGLELEALVAEGVVLGEGLVAVLLAVEAHGLITESGGVGDHRGIGDGAEQQLGNELTGGGSVEVNTLDVLQNASLLRGLRNMQSPVSASELIVLVVADGTQDHREDLIARDLAGGLEGAVGITLDQRSVGAVADVALSPTGASHIAELVVGGVHGSLGILDVSGVHAIHDRGHLSAGDVALGLEGTVLITLEHTHAVQDGDGFGIIRRNLIGILESGVGADSQRQSHDQSQHHCE